MLLSLALIFLCGMAFAKLFSLLHLPRLLGMLLCGIVLGPSCFNLLSQNLLSISDELRQIALIIILTRAGLALDINKLKQVGRPAVLLCFLPAILEITGMVLLAPSLLGLTASNALLLGTVIAAVSPAVVVPKMLALTESGLGTKKSIPQMVMASATVDDVFVIVLFASTLGFLQTGSFQTLSLLRVPSAIIFGLLGGVLTGFLLNRFFSTFRLRDSAKVLILLSMAFLALALEEVATGVLAFSGLLAVMALGASLRAKNEPLSMRLSHALSKLWVAAELLLFVLVGASVPLSYVTQAGFAAILLIFATLLFRMAGVFLCLLRTKLNKKERLFVAASYTPKATVQAAIGGIPLSMGLASGNLILTVAVLSIFITAPLGSILIDRLSTRWLTNE